MPSLRDIKRRIESVKGTQKITKAMKMVAASKLRRAQEAIVQARPYAYEMRALVNSVAARADDDAHPLLRPGGGGRAGIVVVTSDRGLCGGFNAGIVNYTMRVLEGQFKGRDVEFVVVGRKGIEALKRRRVNIRGTFMGQFEGSVMRSAANIINDVVEDYMKGGTDEVYCVYNEFKSAVQQKVTLERMLPFEREARTPQAPPEASEEAGETAESEAPPQEEGTPLDYIYEPVQADVFEALLVRNMYVQMYRVLHESAASEFGARMTAMDAATRNAGDVIDRLTLKYNRARQDAITKELIEVISGAEAL